MSQIHMQMSRFHKQQNFSRNINALKFSSFCRTVNRRFYGLAEEVKCDLSFVCTRKIIQEIRMTLACKRLLSVAP